MRYHLTLLNCLIAGLLWGQTRSAQVSPSLVAASPASVGVSAERLARIDQMCREAIEKDNIPGIVSLVARKGKIVHLQAYGVANEKGDALRTDHIFRIASQTKAITSTAVMMLWEEGHFRLDDPISNWIPEFKDAQVLDTYEESSGTYTTVPADKEITIRHLITHTSGIGYGVIDGDARIKKIYADAGITDLFTTEKITIAESVKKLAKLPLHHHPGEKFTYSEGLDVLGYFIEIVSGMGFDQFLRTRIFDPLGMDDTWFYLPNDKSERLVEVLGKEDGKWRKVDEKFYDIDYPIKGSRTFFSGGAGLSSTAEDYATFLQMYLNGGELKGTRLLSRTTINTIMSSQTDGMWGDTGRNYGLAFGVVTEKGVAQGGRGSIGTFDWGGYFNTQYFADPQEQVIGVIMKQTRGPVDDPTGWKFRQLVGQMIDD